jgi:hypothetical protein
VERHLKRALTPFQRAAVELLCAAKRSGPYDFPGTFECADWACGAGVSFVVRGHLSTVDADGLTRLVILAHDQMIRVSVAGCGPLSMRIGMWPRASREGGLGEKHPTLEAAATQIRGGRR